ncbi:unnamed protein product [Prorocentrum cordatum]|uniref:GrpE protein homolog n=1 Tax=Prorocentrum cordatum TaxID=2364126 RepID=A0ABN9T3U2_9DINO|nr:unnamed protein product [Polarella glacialis]
MGATQIPSRLDRGGPRVMARGAPGRPGLDGVRPIAEKLEAKLRALGLERVETVGAPFDPRRHEAAGRREAPGFGAEVVCEELRSGWLLEDRARARARRGGAAAPAPAAVPSARRGRGRGRGRGPRERLRPGPGLGEGAMRAQRPRGLRWRRGGGPQPLARSRACPSTGGVSGSSQTK